VVYEKAQASPDTADDLRVCLESADCRMQAAEEKELVIRKESAIRSGDVLASRCQSLIEASTRVKVTNVRRL
jgi:hypothetical protein